MAPMHPNPEQDVAEMILNARKVVVFTGAGVSTESGIPDFRSPGGYWEKYQPIMYHDFLTSAEARKEQWRRSTERYLAFAEAKPNAAHLAVAELERIGKLDCVITQNIDGLHQKAGNSPDHVIELHGTNQWVVCLDCGKRYPAAEIQARLEAGVEIPTCDSCKGILKQATISFGQPMPERETREAEVRSRDCDLCIVIGSSLVVYPAAYMPLYAQESGAKLVIINIQPTEFDHLADVVIHEKAGPVMERIVQWVVQRAQPYPLPPTA